MGVSVLHHQPMTEHTQGPYSGGFIAENCRIIFLSGCGPVPSYHKHPHDPVEEAKWYEGGYQEQIDKTFEHIKVLLDAAGADWHHVTRLLIFLNDVAEGQNILNEITYRIFGKENPPARTLIQAYNAHPKMLVEIEATAAVPL